MTENYIASSTALGAEVGDQIFNGAFDALEIALPYMIAFSLFWFFYGYVKALLIGNMDLWRSNHE